MTEHELKPDEWVNRGLAILRLPLRKFVKEQMTLFYGPNWEETALNRSPDKLPIDNDNAESLNLIIDNYHKVFAKVFRDKEPLDIAYRIKSLRNHWAHEKEISDDYAQASLFFIVRFLEFLGCPAEADQVQQIRAHVTSRDHVLGRLNQRRIEAAVYSRLNEHYDIQISPPSYGTLIWRADGRPYAEFLTSDLCVGISLKKALLFVSESEQVMDPLDFGEHSFISTLRTPLLGFGHSALTDQDRFFEPNLKELQKMSRRVTYANRKNHPKVDFSDVAKKIMELSTKSLLDGTYKSFAYCLDPTNQFRKLLSNPIEEVVRVCLRQGIPMRDALKAAVALPTIWLGHRDYPKPMQTLVCGAPILCERDEDVYLGFAWYVNGYMLFPGYRKHRQDPESDEVLELLEGFESIRESLDIGSSAATTLNSKLLSIVSSL